MLTLLRQLRLREVWTAELPALTGAWLTAELFYKFHSFSLECAAFLGTWAVLSWAISFVFRVARPSRVGGPVA